MVARSATCDLGSQFIQELGVGLLVDFATEQTRRSRDRELPHFLAQLFARARTLACHLVVRLRYQALRLARRRSLGFLDDLVRALSRKIDDLRRALARLADDLLGALLGLRQILFAFAGRRQAVRNLLLPLLDRSHEPRPEEFHDRPGNQEE